MSFRWVWYVRSAHVVEMWEFHVSARPNMYFAFNVLMLLNDLLFLKWFPLSGSDPFAFKYIFCKNHFRCPATRTPCLGSSFRWRAVAVCGSYRTLIIDASSILTLYSVFISCRACRPFLLEAFQLFQLFRLRACN